MKPVGVNINVTGLSEATGELKKISNALVDRGKLHAEIAADAEAFTRDYLIGTPRHKTANKLGAKPTGFRARIAKRIEGASDATAAIIRIPRASGLGRAFHDVVIRPGSGKKFLTIPADDETYGKRAGEFPVDSFAFTVVGGRFPALVWRKAGGTHNAWTVAYWLVREVLQKQDRTLLPSDESYQELGRRRAIAHIASLRQNEK